MMAAMTSMLAAVFLFTTVELVAILLVSAVMDLLMRCSLPAWDLVLRLLPWLYQRMVAVIFMPLVGLAPTDCFQRLKLSVWIQAAIRTRSAFGCLGAGSL